ncbi:hypothetical protein GCM10012275_35970 [Longimycelium tulufanense]|uniref:Uncharacterized protein n=1 Tax=Longimycelium tulufanense TaxID=907463 RepID=A0A8J3FVA2_9PSEU|nr:hypothetical protein GCM10012275_35970 [Longimycelium tulufanense]
MIANGLARGGSGLGGVGAGPARPRSASGAGWSDVPVRGLTAPAALNHHIREPHCGLDIWIGLEICPGYP